MVAVAFGGLVPVLVLAWLGATALVSELIGEPAVGPLFWFQLLCIPFAALSYGALMAQVLRRVRRQVPGGGSPAAR